LSWSLLDVDLAGKCGCTLICWSKKEVQWPRSRRRDVRTNNGIFPPTTTTRDQRQLTSRSPGMDAKLPVMVCDPWARQKCIPKQKRWVWKEICCAFTCSATHTGKTITWTNLQLADEMQRQSVSHGISVGAHCLACVPRSENDEPPHRWNRREPLGPTEYVYVSTLKCTPRPKGQNHGQHREQAGGV
jgi:hypothetical protein